MIAEPRSIIRWSILILFFLSTLFLSIDIPQGVFVSPDESAAAVFTNRFATSQQLWIEEPINEELGAIVHPRSAIAIGVRILPVSFLGLPVLYGTLGSLVGSWVLPFLTPLIAVMTLLAWRAIVKTVWNDETLADLSAFMLLIHPAFWYYSSRVFMHNVLFVALLIFAAWFWVTRPLRAHDRHEWFDIFGSGVCVGLALAVRGGEVLWVIAAVAGLFLFVRKTNTWKVLAVWVVGVAIALLPFALVQTSLFGAPWEVGYTVEMEGSIDTGDVTGKDVSDRSAFDHWLEQSAVGSLLLPFGIHEMNILRNSWNYGVILYPWMTVLALVGIVLLVRYRSSRAWLLFTLGVGCWLLVVYGSWSFTDNPDPSAVTIGDSHVRYWLPIFVLLTPFVAHAIKDFSSRWSSRWFPSQAVGERSVTIGIVVICTLLSVNTVFFSPDGVLAARANLMASADKRDLLLANTSAEDIIIVDYADKYLFPDRRLVTPLRDERVYTALPTMVSLTDVYYFGITFPADDLDYLNNDKLANMRLRIDPIVTIGEETLYRITLSP